MALNFTFNSDKVFFLADFLSFAESSSSFAWIVISSSSNFKSDFWLASFNNNLCKNARSSLFSYLLGNACLVSHNKNWLIWITKKCKFGGLIAFNHPMGWQLFLGHLTNLSMTKPYFVVNLNNYIQLETYILGGNSINLKSNMHWNCMCWFGRFIMLLVQLWRIKLCLYYFLYYHMIYMLLNYHRVLIIREWTLYRYV